MASLQRREFISSVTAGLAGWSLSAGLSHADEVEQSNGDLYIAPFRFDVTPPVGHSCCGGWIKPVVAVDDPLEAIGFVVLGCDKPIVICAVDWTGIMNEAHLQWRTALADGAGTTADRVAVQCVHQHNAPFACLGAEAIVEAQGDLPHIVDVDFFRRCVDRGREAVGQAVKQARRVTHVGTGQAKVQKVASNRRVFRDEARRVRRMRGSSCRDAELRALPEGLIDPWLKTVAFYDGDKKIVACHYYATHPMSYYGDGRVSSDFAGLARKQRQKDDPACTHVYFTGCAGDIAAGKYNDGSKELRSALTGRVHQGIVQAEADIERVELDLAAWKTVDLLPPQRDTLSIESLEKQIGNRENRVVSRNRPAYMLSWLRRLKSRMPIVLSSLYVGQVCLLHLPAECFVQYQLRAQSAAPSKFVATAAYGDGGPWYIPVKEEYPCGGYEVSVAFCDPAVDDLLTAGMKNLLS